ncbi:MAG: MBL fold metallo-hydrolase [Kiritimatiellales bacterium]
MVQALNVTVLSNNCVFKKGLLAEHGWSLWIEADDHIFLWDTGQGLAIEHNARELNLDLRRIEAVLLSHGHYDHTGGLRNVLKYAPHAKIYCHPAVFQPQYRREPGGKKSREIGLPFYTQETLEAACGGLIASAEPVEIISGVWMSGEIPRDHGSGWSVIFISIKTVPCRAAFRTIKHSLLKLHAAPSCSPPVRTPAPSTSCTPPGESPATWEFTPSSADFLFPAPNPGRHCRY